MLLLSKKKGQALNEVQASKQMQRVYRERMLGRTRVLVHTVFHCVRTSLNQNFQLLAELNRTGLASPEVQTEYLVPIINETQILFHKLNDIQDWHAFQNKNFRLVFEEFNLEESARVCCLMFANQLRLKGLEIHVKIEYGGTGLIYNDQSRFQQILANLVSNAVKFSERGEISVRIQEVRARQFRVDVSDEGTGIDFT